MPIHNKCHNDDTGNFQPGNREPHSLQFRLVLHRFSILFTTDGTPRRDAFNKHGALKYGVQNCLCGHAMSMLLASVPCYGDGKNVPL